MYRQLFGFSKNPFRQTPDPAYLFLGRHHEEAMAHLTYAVMKAEGFSAITGAPGVGKTTVCRSYLQQLGEEVQAAYIHDAVGLSPLKLLQRINAAFQIPSNLNNIKDLTDTLNEFLIEKSRLGHKVVLFIDDAHALSNDVLEQVRLLSNLETTRHKLIQIILVGRPELSERLASRELRQIGQRVSVNWHIDPLSFEETLAYVQHRISVSSMGPPVRFDQSAVKPLHRFADGNPRRINAACDHILKEAYARRERTIDADIAKSALQSLTERREFGPDGFSQRPTMLLIGAVLLALIAFAGGAYVVKQGPAHTRAVAAVVTKPVGPFPAASAPQPAVSPEPEQAEEALVDLFEKLKQDIGQPPPVPSAEAAAVHDLPAPVAVEADKGPAEGTPPVRLTHSVQVGAFLAEANARKRLDNLKNDGYLPRIVTVTGPDGLTWFTVRIGDYPSLDIARQAADRFTATEDKSAAVRPYGMY